MMSGTDIDIAILRSLIEKYATIKRDYQDSMNSRYYEAKEQLEKFIRTIKIVENEHQ